MDRETLLRYEPKVAKLFLNSRKRERLSNAYLLHGPRNAPLKEVALYLAQSLSCQKDFLACNQCDSCHRFLMGIRPDFALIEGDTGTIKKEQVKNLESAFSLSALEKGHTLSYVISEVDNITDEAANSLLKFLEEPREGQIAFLTTTNLTRVLPTIRSRSIALRIDPIEPDLFFRNLTETEFVDGKGESLSIPTTSLFLLSRLFPSKESIQEVLQEDETILTAFSAVEAFLEDYALSPKTGAFSLLLSAHQIKEGKCYNWMYLALDELFDEVLFDAYDEDNPFRDVLAKLGCRKKGIEKAKTVLKKALSLRQINLSNTCLLAQILKSLSEVN